MVQKLHAVVIIFGLVSGSLIQEAISATTTNIQCNKQDSGNKIVIIGDVNILGGQCNKFANDIQGAVNVIGATVSDVLSGKGQCSDGLLKQLAILFYGYQSVYCCNANYGSTSSCVNGDQQCNTVNQNGSSGNTICCTAVCSSGSS